MIFLRLKITPTLSPSYVTLNWQRRSKYLFHSLKCMPICSSL